MAEPSKKVLYDCLDGWDCFKVRENGKVINKTVWVGKTESSSFLAWRSN